MRKFMSLALTVVLATSLVACGSKSSDGKASDGTAAEKVLSVQIGPDPETMDPALNSAIDGGNMVLHSFECLLTLDKDGKAQAGQAEKWETSKDGLTWTFHLRDGLKWSDGSALTANDFVYSFQRVCNPKTAAPYAETVLGMVKGYKEAAKGDVSKLAVVAKDDKTLEITLNAPCTYFDSIIAFATLSPVNKATIEKNGDAWATKAETYVSNGPFYMTEWVPGSHITFSKNPNYWDAGSIKLDKLKFVLMEDSNASYSAYQTGQIQLCKDVPTEEIPALKDNKEFNVEPIIGTYYLNLNDQNEKFKDVRVRQALSLAIDRDYVANTIMQGTYTPAYNLFGKGWLDTDGSDFASNANGGQPYISTDYAANLEKAKGLLKEAGYENGKGLTFTYTTNDTAYHKAVAEYLQKAWKELGVEVKVEIVEWSSFTPKRRAGDYESARNGWVGDYTDPSNMLDVFYSTNGNNDGKYKSAEFDKYSDLAKTTTDAKERSEALHKAEDTLMADMGCIPLAYYNDFWLQSEKLTGSWHSANGYWYFMYADITQ
ncbi:MAG: peptide ABC transporter substrate-binding protein [bacterium]|nr:peptide ABC transporter substrate-binding protein [bacterium]